MFLRHGEPLAWRDFYVAPIEAEMMKLKGDKVPVEASIAEFKYQAPADIRKCDRFAVLVKPYIPYGRN